MKKIAGLFILILSLFLLAAPTHAAEFRGDKRVLIPKEATISGSLFVAGESVEVAGTVNGDLFCAGQHVTITGTVTGDVICAGQSVLINGSVEQDVRVAGQTVSFEGPVLKNVTVFGQHVDVRPRSNIFGEVFSFAQNLTVGGHVYKDLSGGAQLAAIDGRIDGDVKLKTESLQVGPQASVAGNLSYESTETATIPQTASLAGTLTRTEPTNKNAREWHTVSNVQRKSGGSLAGVIIKIIFYSLLGLALVAVAPAFSERTLANADRERLRSFGFGIASFIVIPLLLVLSVITIIGIPVTILGVFAWMFFLMVSRLLVSVWVGRWVLMHWFTDKRDSSLWQIVLGTVVTVALFKLPFVGIIGGLMTVWMFGAQLLLLPWFSGNKIVAAKTSKKA